jgi:5-methylcytosine-specific restriction endonuclease McrA
MKMSATIVFRLKQLVRQERRVTAEILTLLMKVEDQKIFAEMRYPSIYEFCRKELKYSEGSAYRRIATMRLMRDNMEVKTKIESGELSLTTATKVQSTISKMKAANVKVSQELCQDMIKSVVSKSKREVEKTLADQVIAIAPQLADSLKESERVEQMGGGFCRIEMVMPVELLNQLDTLLAANSHAVPSGKYLDLLKYLAKGKLAHRKPVGEANSHRNSAGGQTGKMESDQIRKADGRKNQAPGRKYIAVAIRKDVRARADGSCTYVDPKTGWRCGQKHFLQIDHIAPVALGGNSQPENLRLLCGVHNRLEASRLGLGRRVRK